MKITISKSYLNESIQHVAKAISSRTTIPILSGIKIDAQPNGVTLTGSDTDISIQSYIPIEADGIEIIQIEKPGSVVLPSKFFIEIIKKLPSESIEIEVKDHFQTSIRSGTSDIQMVGLDPEEYPLLPSIDHSTSVSVASDLLKTMIRQTTFAVSTNESTPILTGVLWNMSSEALKLIACDRHRLATRETAMQLNQTPSGQIVISGKTLNELAKILPDQNILIEIVFSDNQVLFKLERILFLTRILDGTYPDTSKLIPQTYQTEVVLDTRELTDAMDRANLLSREEKTNIVKLIVKEDQTIEISSSSSELGKVTETITSKSFSGDLLRISFNSKFMLDALKVMESEHVRLGFTGAMSPIIIRPENGTSLMQLILPYRTTN